MKLHFDSNQEYQIEAIRAVTDIFEGQPLSGGGVKSCKRSLKRVFARATTAFQTRNWISSSSMTSSIAWGGRVCRKIDTEKLKYLLMVYAL